MLLSQEQFISFIWMILLTCEISVNPLVIKPPFSCQKLVVENMDILVQMKNNFEKPEKMEGLKKRLTGEE